MSVTTSTIVGESSEAGGDGSGSRPAKLKWTEDETQALVEGCNKHGVGSWTQILSDAELLPRFSDRTPGDLKDRFRTYFPDSYHEMYPNAKTHWGNQSRGKAPDGRSIFEKGKVKERRPFTEEEDRALLRGYKLYGSHWALIARDPAFKNQRRSTDVRDRFRNAFPEEYARAGYKPRSKAKSKNAAKNKAAAQANEATAVSTTVNVPQNFSGPPHVQHQGQNGVPVPGIYTSMQTASNGSSTQVDWQTYGTPISADYGFPYSQALLSPVMLQARSDVAVPFDRANIMEWFDPNAQSGQVLNRTTASEVPRDSLVPPSSRNRALSAGIWPNGQQRTRSATYGDLPSNSYPMLGGRDEPEFSSVDRAWDITAQDYPMGRGSELNNVSLFPPLQTNMAPPPNDYYLSHAPSATTESSQSHFHPVGDGLMSSLSAPAALPSSPAVDQSGMARMATRMQAPITTPMSTMSKSVSEAASTSSAQNEANMILGMGLSEMNGLSPNPLFGSSSLEGGTLSSSGLDHGVLTAPFSKSVSPFLTQGPNDANTPFGSLSMDKSNSLPLSTPSPWDPSASRSRRDNTQPRSTPSQ